MTIINDPLLAPYYIGKDAHCYTAYEVITPDPKYSSNGEGSGQDYTKPIGHYGTFGSALRAIMKAKLNKERKVYGTIEEYIKHWEDIQESINKVTEFNQL